MEEKTPMKLSKLELRQFTVFEEASFDFCAGINVLVGKNSTGKSHVLKAMYALLRGLHQARGAGEREHDELTAERFRRIFLPDDLGRLVRRPAPSLMQGAEMLLSSGETEAVFTLKGGVARVLPGSFVPPHALFITSRDVLAIFEGFVSLYDKREVSFDETYADLCRALGLQRLRERPALLERTESLLGGTVRLEGERFYVKLGVEEFEAHLVGEGLRKIATVAQLIANGSLTRDSVLFWDEPEAGLNPQMIADIAEFIRGLAAWGVQIFIATHDYLLSRRLSLAAGSRLPPVVPARFFSLHRERPDDPVVVQPGETLEELENNPIVQAYADYYSYQRELFSRTKGDDA